VDEEVIAALAESSAAYCWVYDYVTYWPIAWCLKSVSASMHVTSVRSPN